MVVRVAGPRELENVLVVPGNFTVLGLLRISSDGMIKGFFWFEMFDSGIFGGGGRKI